MTFEYSEWRNAEAWQRRLAADHAALEARLSADQRQVLEEIAGMLGAGDRGDILALDFMVVFGSSAFEGASSTSRSFTPTDALRRSTFASAL